MAGAASAAAAAAIALAPLVDATVEPAQTGPAWRLATLPRQKPPVTRFSAERVDGRAALRIDAQASYGNLVHALPPHAVLQRLGWSWRMQQPNAAVDLRSRAGDDMAAKVCVAFDLPIDRVPLAERALLQLARAVSGEPLPGATLCWAWGAGEPRGALIDNAHSRRVRYIVLRNGGDAVGAWLDEARDVQADFRRAFGDEWPAAQPVPAVLAVIVGGDADNTRGHSVAQVADLRAAP